MQQFLADFYELRLAEDDDFVWIAWLEAIALLGLRVLAPLVHSAWNEGRIPEGMLDRSDFDNDLAEAERARRCWTISSAQDLGYINNLLLSAGVEPRRGERG